MNNVITVLNIESRRHVNVVVYSAIVINVRSTLLYMVRVPVTMALKITNSWYKTNITLHCYMCAENKWLPFAKGFTVRNTAV